MNELKRIDEMTDDELYDAAIKAYNNVKHPSENLKRLYELWFTDLPTDFRKRIHSETIYKLSLFEEGALGEEAW